jgi:glyoxylase-like metal-dependent hydrolase (beta-lactamase superfamily II)
MDSERCAVVISAVRASAREVDPMNAPNYEVFALRYATHQNRTARANFITVDTHDVPMPLDYFVWVIRGPTSADSQSTIVVDTGMDAAAAARRPGRVILTPVGDMLNGVGVDPALVRDVVLTHMHFDHAGSIDLFSAATFHIQDSEMAFCTGRCMCHRVLRDTFEVDHVISAVRRVYDGRMRFHDGTAEIARGITLHLIGGHSGGLQVVRVPTARGWVVLASDATHFWANIRTRSPFPIVVDMARMLEGYDIVESLADGPDHIIPGHDPLVLSRFPSVPGMRDVVRLDLPPVG